jgi:hypothetical protein
LRTPKRAAVSGISCISPWRFSVDSATVSKRDSTSITDSTSCGCTCEVRRDLLDQSTMKTAPRANRTCGS